jgi:hypothetical protein
LASALGSKEAWVWASESALASHYFEGEWHCGKKQERPLRKSSAHDRRDLATVADGAVDLALFDVLDSELLSFRSDCDPGDD